MTEHRKATPADAADAARVRDRILFAASEALGREYPDTAGAAVAARTPADPDDPPQDRAVVVAAGMLGRFAEFACTMPAGSDPLAVWAIFARRERTTRHLYSVAPLEAS